jgi:hypothetical protein
MAEVALSPTPYGDLYAQALQQREQVYAAYNSGAFADTIRLAREHARLCGLIREQKRERVPLHEE